MISQMSSQLRICLKILEKLSKVSCARIHLIHLYFGLSNQISISSHFSQKKYLKDFEQPSVYDAAAKLLRNLLEHFWGNDTRKRDKSGVWSCVELSASDFTCRQQRRVERTFACDFQVFSFTRFALKCERKFSMSTNQRFHVAFPITTESAKFL